MVKDELVAPPSTRWVDEIVGTAGPGWVSLAQERDIWTDLVDAYIHEGELSEEGGNMVPSYLVYLYGIYNCKFVTSVLTLVKLFTKCRV